MVPVGRCGFYGDLMGHTSTIGGLDFSVTTYSSTVILSPSCWLTLRCSMSRGMTFEQESHPYRTPKVRYVYPQVWSLNINTCGSWVSLYALDNEFEPPDQSHHADVDTTEDYLPSEMKTESSDDINYKDDHRALDIVGRLIFTVIVTAELLAHTFEIPYGFWHRHIPMGALIASIYFLADKKKWMLMLVHTNSRIWVKHEWKRFRRDNGLAEGDRLILTLINPDDITFYVLVEKA